MDAEGRDERHREVDAEAAASAKAISALHSGPDRGRSSLDHAGGTARRQAADLREQELDRRERRWARREAAADQRQGLLDEREGAVTGREYSADQREIDAEVAGWDDDGPGRLTGGLDPDAVMMRLGELALSLQDLDDVGATLQAIVAAAVDTVPRATFAGLSVASKRAVSPIVVTDEVVTRVDQAQQATGEGPAMTSLRERLTIRVADMATETRWPRFAARAAQTGVGSMLAVRVFVHREDLGVLTLYSLDTHAFDDDAEQIAVLFAAHAAVALAGAQHEQHLTTALTTRDAIGQAKGILMERHRLTADQAFAVLTRASQDTNTKLVDVVRVLTDTGALARPGADPDRDAAK